MAKKVMSAAEAAALIEDGVTVTTSGFVGIGVPETLLKAVGKRFEESGHPKGLSLIFAAGQGDGDARGLNHLAGEGLLSKVIGGHWGLIPKVGALSGEGGLQAYNLPQGVISHLYRDIAAGKPGTLTHVGLETFVDPRKGGGKLNGTTTEDIVHLMEIGGQEWLFYDAMPIHVALLRGTTADTFGNVSMEREALTIDNLSQAMAVKNSGGIVIVQVERVVERGSLSPRQTEIPGILVDAVVVADPGDHMQTYATEFSSYFANQFREPVADADAPPLTPRKIIARRALFEIAPGDIVNLGIGMPEGVAGVASEEGLLEHVTLTAEPGVVGGMPASGLNFGAAVNTDAIIAQNQQFDYYDGGGLDIAVLGMAQADSRGSVNVSRFGPVMAGCGGFINIAQNAGRVVFCGTFTSKGLEVDISDGRLTITTEGEIQKFRDEVEHTTHFGPRSLRTGQPLLFVTERAVFELTEDGMRLTEVAPGIDIERDILQQMAFAPAVDAPAEMDGRLFREGPMFEGEAAALDFLGQRHAR